MGIDVVAVVVARGGSKGLPKKNVLPLVGKPLIAWTISKALQSKSFNRIIVSTDDEEIAHIAQKWGAEVPFMRPPELAQDDSSVVAVIEQALHWLEENERQLPNYVMLLQPTSPLRTAADIKEAIDIAQRHNAVAVVSVSLAKQHPYISKRILDDGTLTDYVPNDMTDLRRQVLPPAYALNGAIYLSRSKSLLDLRTFWPEGTYAHIMPAERSIDIDTPWDFHLAELILREQCEKENI